MADTKWIALRALLAAEFEAMSWRLASLNATQRDEFLDELTDRLYAHVELLA
jgi:hypothetical protein